VLVWRHGNQRIQFLPQIKHYESPSLQRSIGLQNTQFLRQRKQRVNITWVNLLAQCCHGNQNIQLLPKKNASLLQRLIVNNITRRKRSCVKLSDLHENWNDPTIFVKLPNIKVNENPFSRSGFIDWRTDRSKIPGSERAYKVTFWIWGSYDNHWATGNRPFTTVTTAGIETRTFEYQTNMLTTRPPG
jgi:hypothetical protein